MGQAELKIFKLLPSFIPYFKHPEIICIELGAYNGKDTLTLSNIWKKSGKPFKHYFWEADPRWIKHIKEQEWPDGCLLIDKAVNDFTGTCDFFISGGERPTPSKGRFGIWSKYDGSSSVTRPTEHMFKRWKGMLFDETTQVNCMTLDDFSEQENINHVDFIWADIQGAESKMIKGGIKTLSKTRFLFTEYSGNIYEGGVCLNELLKILPNFKAHSIFRNDVLLVNKLIK